MCCVKSNGILLSSLNAVGLKTNVKGAYEHLLFWNAYLWIMSSIYGARFIICIPAFEVLIENGHTKMFL